MGFFKSVSLMTMFLSASHVLGSPTVHYLSSRQTESGFVCQTLTIPVPLKQTVPQNYTMDNYDIEFFYQVQAFNIFKSGVYNVSAVYCAPPKNYSSSSSGVKVKDAIQFLNHGATFKKEMWDFPYQPETYSWVQRMHAQGYPTFAWDQIGCGASVHPGGNGGLFEVQTQGIIESARYLVGLLKQGEIGGTKYAKVAYVGFSIGAVAGVSLTAQYPDVVDAVILHGYSWVVTDLYPGYLAGLQAPVNTLGISAWANYSSFYQSQSTPQSRQAVVFYGDFDPAVLPIDYNEIRDMDALGLALSFGFHLIAAPKYTGPVFLGNGNQDSSFCGNGCGSRPYAAYDNYPKASDIDIKVYNNTGHGIHMHYSAPQLMSDTLAFLSRNGL